MNNIKVKLLSFVASMFLFVATFTPIAFAETMPVITFDFYSPGIIHNQDGWSSLGAAGLGCALYDHKVDSSFGALGFGTQSLRISNAVTSGCFSDQTFSKSLTNEAGETSAQNNGLSGGVREDRFEAEFDLTTKFSSTYQPGLSMSVSPDRGDGARMSYLRFEDQVDGVHVFFDDYQDVAPFGSGIGDADGCGTGDDFVEEEIALLPRMPHKFKFVMDFVDGTRNDVVNIYINGALVHTGTSWEDYFRYCEGNETRTVDSLLFRTGGTDAPSTAGHGFLIDNIGLVSEESPFIGLPTSRDQCKDDGWMTYTNPTFKNQGQCVSYVEHQ